MTDKAASAIIWLDVSSWYTDTQKIDVGLHRSQNRSNNCPLILRQRIMNSLPMNPQKYEKISENITESAKNPLHVDL
jgi:hypothetical protein